MKIRPVLKNEIKELEEWYDKIDSAEKNNLNFYFHTDSFFLMCSEDGQKVGIMSISEDTRYYNDFKRFVVLKFRSKNYGEKFIDYLIELAKKNNKVWISGTIREENIKATNFFISKGFEIKPYAKIEDEKYNQVMLKLF